MAQSGVVRYLPSHRYRQWEGALPLSDDDRQREALGAVANTRPRPEPLLPLPTMGEFYTPAPAAADKTITYAAIVVGSIVGCIILTVVAIKIFYYITGKKPPSLHAGASTAGANKCCGGGASLYFPY